LLKDGITSSFRNVIPGDRLGSVRELRSGSGTYVRGLHVHSSIVGKFMPVAIQEEKESSESLKKEEMSVKYLARVVRECGKPISTISQVLKIGQIVLCKVTHVGSQQAWVDIFAACDLVEETTDKNKTVAQCSSHLSFSNEILNYNGSIRKKDARGGVLEEVLLGDSFRPGDVCLARIISLGDARRYYLSTAESELGVVRALSSSGHVMSFVSNKEMICPVTQKRELRKCCKAPQLKHSSINL